LSGGGCCLITLAIIVVAIILIRKSQSKPSLTDEDTPPSESDPSSNDGSSSDDEPQSDETELTQNTNIDGEIFSGGTVENSDAAPEAEDAADGENEANENKEDSESVPSAPTDLWDEPTTLSSKTPAQPTAEPEKSPLPVRTLNVDDIGEMADTRMTIIPPDEFDTEGDPTILIKRKPTEDQ